MTMAYCLKCHHSHRFMSSKWVTCFGVKPQDCGLVWLEDDRVRKVIGHDNSFTWPVRVGDSLMEFISEYEEYFNMGITVYENMP